MAIDVIQQSPENHLRKVLSAVQSADLLLRHAQWEKGTRRTLIRFVPSYIRPVDRDGAAGTIRDTSSILRPMLALLLDTGVATALVTKALDALQTAVPD